MEWKLHDPEVVLDLSSPGFLTSDSLYTYAVQGTDVLAE